MPLSTLTPGDEKQDEKLNPGQGDYDSKFNNLANAENTGTFNDIMSNEGFPDSFGDELSSNDKRAADISSRESEGTHQGKTWDTNVTENLGAKKSKSKAWFKRSAPLIGVGGGLGIVGVLFVSLFSGSMLPISLMENLTATGDSSSVAMGRRGPKVLQNMMTATPTECISSKLKCRASRLSNSALTKMEKKGFKPVYLNEATNPVKNAGKKTGYPSRNPDAYEVEINGKKTQVKAGQELTDLLLKDKKQAAKLLGRSGAFNMRMTAWVNKQAATRMFKLGARKDGGLANAKKTAGSDESVRKNLLQQLRDRTPNSDRMKNVAGDAAAKVDKHIGKSKKGGAGYTVAVGSCMAVKAPSFIAAGVAAVQVSQLIPILYDSALSPGAKMKASGMGGGNIMTPEGVDNIGTLFTERTPRKSDGKLTSALDSKYLQAAMGINTNKVGPVKDYAPGYAFMNSKAAKLGASADKKTKTACNAILSPAAMYSAMTVDAAVTIATSMTGVGAIIKVVGSFAIAAAVNEIVSNIVESQAQAVIEDLAKNDAILTAVGEKRGDITAAAAAVAFSANGAANGLSTLTVDQLEEFEVVKAEESDHQRQMDIASLSPFDTSSKYTFMGSIAHNFATTALKNNIYSSGPLSILTTIAQMPMSLLTNNISANTSASKNYCDNAKDFQLESDIPGKSPAINIGGAPCTGITESQARMSTEYAIDLLENEGWFDDSVDLPDNSSIDEMVASGYIKADTPLADYISDCTDLGTGDYLFNAGSCITSSESKSLTTFAEKGYTGCVDITNDDGSTTKSCATDEGSGYNDNQAPSNLKNPRSQEAISVFIIDQGIQQTINGEIDLTAPATEQPADTGSGNGESVNVADLHKESKSIPCAPGTNDAGVDIGYRNKVGVDVRICSLPNTKISAGSTRGVPARVNSRISGQAFSMLEDMRQHLGVEKVSINDSFRTMTEQKFLYNKYGSVQAAFPGTSNHQMGLALDINMGAANKGNATGYVANVNTSYPSSKPWIWLKANASKYNFTQLAHEGWHWEVTAR